MVWDIFTSRFFMSFYPHTHSYLFFKGNHFNELKEYLLTRLLWYIVLLFSKYPLLIPPLLAPLILGLAVGLASINGPWKTGTHNWTCDRVVRQILSRSCPSLCIEQASLSRDPWRKRHVDQTWGRPSAWKQGQPTPSCLKHLLIGIHVFVIMN